MNPPTHSLPGTGTTVRRCRPGLTTLAVAGVAVLVLAGCGSSSSSSTTSTPSSGSSGGAAQGPPGVTGTIAAASAGTLQVQNQAGQTAVTYTPTTPVTKTVPATRSALTPGVCVTVVSAATGQPNTASGAAATGPIAAQTVTVSAPVDGSCNRVFGGLGGRRSGSGARPTARPSTGSGGARFGGANGKVTSVTADSFVVTRTGRPGAPSTGSPTTGTPTTETVTTTAGTTYLRTEAATASALAVGQCVTAIGPANDTGAVAATSLAVRPPGPNGCVAFGRRAGGAA